MPLATTEISTKSDAATTIYSELPTRLSSFSGNVDIVSTSPMTRSPIFPTGVVTDPMRPPLRTTFLSVTTPGALQTAGATSYSVARTNVVQYDPSSGAGSTEGVGGFMVLMLVLSMVVGMRR